MCLESVSPVWVTIVTAIGGLIRNQKSTSVAHTYVRSTTVPRIEDEAFLNLQYTAIFYGERSIAATARQISIRDDRAMNSDLIMMVIIRQHEGGIIIWISQLITAEQMKSRTSFYHKIPLRIL